MEGPCHVGSTWHLQADGTDITRSVLHLKKGGSDKVFSIAGTKLDCSETKCEGSVLQRKTKIIAREGRLKKVG